MECARRRPLARLNASPGEGKLSFYHQTTNIKHTCGQKRDPRVFRRVYAGGDQSQSLASHRALSSFPSDNIGMSPTREIY